MVRIVVAFLFMLAAGGAAAGEAAPASNDPALEARVMEIAAELRCLVCQNQTIADSHAPLAQDLREQIRTQLKAGSGEGEIMSYMVARYGDFVLYRPPVKATTVLLWGGPLLLAVLGLLFLARRLRTRRASPPEKALSPEEKAEAAAILNDTKGGSAR